MTEVAAKVTQHQCYGWKGEELLAHRSYCARETSLGIAQLPSGTVVFPIVSRPSYKPFSILSEAVRLDMSSHRKLTL